VSWLFTPSQNETPAIQRGGWLDALRFIVASLMILHHWQAAGPAPLAEIIHPAFERGGFLLTNFFLMDSGYVLMRVYGSRTLNGQMSHSDFFLKRALRVFPAHLIMGLALVTLVVVTGLVGLAPRNPEWFDWRELPAQLLLLQSLGMPGGLGWNAPSWSLSALLGCYVCFPWLIRLVCRLSPWTALAAGIVFYGAANLLTWSWLHYPVWQMPMEYGVFRALPLFLFGMCLAWFATHVFIPRRMATVMGIAAAVGFVVLQYFDKNALMSLVMIALIILAAGALPPKTPSKLVSQAAMVSFSIFISNEVVRIAWFGVVNVLVARYSIPVAVHWALWAISIPLAIAFAYALHFFIDAPGQKRVQGWLSGRRKRRVAPNGARALP
jgi:peptidoglycan/LPS O-acetylase OafA/YrhL